MINIEIPTQEGIYFVTCMENDYELEEVEVKYMQKNKTVDLYAKMDGLWYTIDTWQYNLTDITWYSSLQP